MQAGFGGRLESAQGGFYVVLFRAGERRYPAILDFGGHGPGRVQISGRGYGEARFDNIHTELLDLPGELELLLAIHRKTGGLFAVAQRGIENLHVIHGNSFHSASEPRTAQGVQFIMVATRINISYIEEIAFSKEEPWIWRRCRCFRPSCASKAFPERPKSFSGRSRP